VNPPDSREVPIEDPNPVSGDFALLLVGRAFSGTNQKGRSNGNQRIVCVFLRACRKGRKLSACLMRRIIYSPVINARCLSYHSY
jgi:hypothetical protein